MYKLKMDKEKCKYKHSRRVSYIDIYCTLLFKKAFFFVSTSHGGGRRGVEESEMRSVDVAGRTQSYK